MKNKAEVAGRMMFYAACLTFCLGFWAGCAAGCTELVAHASTSDCESIEDPDHRASPTASTKGGA